jgi:hypothetical protein
LVYCKYEVIVRTFLEPTSGLTSTSLNGWSIYEDFVFVPSSVSNQNRPSLRQFEVATITDQLHTDTLLPLNPPKPPSPSVNMAAQQNPTPSVHNALLQIIVSDSSMTSSLEKYTTAVIPVSVDMDPQDLEIQLDLLFQDDLFGIKKQIPNREVHFAIWSIRWNDVWVLPDMVMIKRLDFERGLALMQARGWRDTLVVRCELTRKG